MSVSTAPAASVDGKRRCPGRGTCSKVPPKVLYGARPNRPRGWDASPYRAGARRGPERANPRGSLG